MTVNAWGPFGHATVAAVALRYLKPQTLWRVQEILSHDTLPAQTLVTVSSWPDVYRKTKDGAYSYHYHFVDTKENDPLRGVCNIDLARDCPPHGCIVTAIANYTRRVADDDLDRLQNAEALKFLVHFFGDLHQPLHAQDFKRGGNDVPVLFGGQPSNLHRAWDLLKIQDVFGNYTVEKAMHWAHDISREIDEDVGSYHDLAKAWRSCQDIQNSETCALLWASESNKLSCDYVFAKDPTNKEIRDDFYPDWVPTLQRQIAKGGVRLAAWLNVIFTGTDGFSDDTLTVMSQEKWQHTFDNVHHELRI